MGVVTRSVESWVAAGGDPARLALLERVGRVAVFSDGASRCFAGVHPDRPQVGAVADWVGGVEALRAAEAWLAEQGCRAVEGPMWLCPWFPYRANLGPADAPPLAFEPTDPGERWSAAGYLPAFKYVSVVTPHEPQIRAAVDKAGALSSRGWRLEPVRSGPSSEIDDAAWDAAVGLVHEIASRAFAGVDGFVRVPVEVLADFYRPLRKAVDPRLVLFVRDPEGRPAGFLLGAPDAARPDRKWFQILTLAVVPEHRSAGVATWMVAAAHQAARKAGFAAGVHALVRVDAGPSDSQWFRGDVVRRYALFRRSLP